MASNFYSTIEARREEFWKRKLFDSNLSEVEVVEALHAYEPNLQERRQLFIRACRSDYSQVAELLIKDLDLDPSYMGDIALTEAAKYNSVSVMRLLLDDARVLAADREGRMEENIAIIYACNRCHPRAVRILLRDGRVHPELKDNLAASEVYKHVKAITDNIFSQLLYKNPEMFDTTDRTPGGTVVPDMYLVQDNLHLVNPRVREGLQGYIHILSVLLSDSRVMNTLDPVLYNTYSSYLGG